MIAENRVRVDAQAVPRTFEHLVLELRLAPLSSTEKNAQRRDLRRVFYERGNGIGIQGGVDVGEDVHRVLRRRGRAEDRAAVVNIHGTAEVGFGVLLLKGANVRKQIVEG